MLSTSISPCMPLVTFKLLPQCWNSEGVNMSRWVHVCIPQEELLGAQVVSSTNSTPTGFCSQKLYGLIFLVLEPWARGPGCGAGTPCSWDILPEFLSTTCGCGTSLFCICSPPTSLDGCGFFNSLVVKLPLKSVSDGSEWWFFYILVVILTWMCEEVSHVCLCYHLFQNSSYVFDFKFQLFVADILKRD